MVFNEVISCFIQVMLYLL